MTLEELIKACQNIIGDEVICIGTMFKDNGCYELGPWHAATYSENRKLTSTDYIPPEMTATAYGKTVDEAVANLWLKLSNK